MSTGVIDRESVRNAYRNQTGAGSERDIHLDSALPLQPAGESLVPRRPCFHPRVFPNDRQNSLAM